MHYADGNIRFWLIISYRKVSSLELGVCLCMSTHPHCIAQTAKPGCVCLLSLCSQHLRVRRPVCACVHSQLGQICASMCHSECRRLAGIKAVTLWSSVRAESELSAPSPSVIGHTYWRTKGAEAGTDWTVERNEGGGEWEAKRQKRKNKD